MSHSSSRASQVGTLVSAMQSGMLTKAEREKSSHHHTQDRKPQQEEEGPPGKIVADLVGAMREGRLSKSELMTSLSSLRESSSPHEIAPPRPVAPAVRRSQNEAEMWAELGSGAKRRGGRSATPTRSSSSARRRKTTTPKQPGGVLRRSASFSTTRDYRSSELDECTFQPRIKKLPAEYSTSQKRRRERFLDRVERWRIERDRELERNVARDEEYTMGECTFQPRISQHSRRSASLSRASDARPADQRLYEDDKNRRIAREARRSLDSSLRESRFAEEHPFAPNLVSTKNSSVKPRYALASPSRPAPSSSSEDVSKDDIKQCTFVPSVNGVRDDMDLAKVYLSAGVFDRLSARKKNKQIDRKEEQQDDRRSSSSSVVVEKSVVDKFLARQAAFDAKRVKKVDDLRQSTQPRFRPSLVTPSKSRPSTPTSTSDRNNRNTSSPAPATPRNSDGFMDRLAVSERRRRRRMQQQQLEETPTHNSDIGGTVEFTFTPTISEFAARRSAGRSVDEMSTGDALRRETSRRLLKLKAEHEEKRTNSFKPKLVSHQRPSAQSKLRVSSAPDTYLDRLKRESERRVEQRRRALDEKDRRLLEDVTFEPQTTRCPTYIKRIARGMALAKKAADFHPKTEYGDAPRPGWR